MNDSHPIEMKAATLLLFSIYGWVLQFKNKAIVVTIKWIATIQHTYLVKGMVNIGLLW